MTTKNGRNVFSKDDLKDMTVEELITLLINIQSDRDRVLEKLIKANETARE